MIFSVRRTTLFPAIAGAGKWLRVRCNEQSMGSTRDSDPHINPSDFARIACSATSPRSGGGAWFWRYEVAGDAPPSVG